MSEKGSTNRDPSRRETLVRGALMAAIGSVAVIYFVVSVFRPPLKADNFTNSYSTSPGGHFALVELLRENKREVRTVNKSLRPPEDQYNETDTLTLLEPGPQYVEHYSSEFEELFDLARERYSSVMLVLPKRHYVVGESDPDDPDAQENEVVLYEEDVELDLVRGELALAGFDRWLDVGRSDDPGQIRWVADEMGTTVDLEQPVQYFHFLSGIPSEFEVLAETGNGDPVILRYEKGGWNDKGGVILVADGDIFTNRFINKPGAATIAMDVFAYTPQQGAILIDEDLHGFSTDVLANINSKGAVKPAAAPAAAAPKAAPAAKPAAAPAKP